MIQLLASVVTLAALLLSPNGAKAGHVDWVLQEGDAYSRVVCRAAGDTERARKKEIFVLADLDGRGPTLSCVLENYEIVVENDLLEEKPIKLKGLTWGPWKDGMASRRYFVLPEVCFETNGTWRCRKQVHEKSNKFEIELPTTCPYKVKVGALPIVTTNVTNKTQAPLQPAGTMLLEDSGLTSNPFSFHPNHDVDGAYYRDLAIVYVRCPPQPLVHVQTLCGNGVLEANEICDDGNQFDDDGCTRQCLPTSNEPFCGDGNIDPGEICDDGNRNDLDGCNNACQPPSIVPPSCGDGIVHPHLGETCEPGMVLPPTDGGAVDRSCRDDCSYCGDAIVDANEECDDGNDDDGDGCTNACTNDPYRFCEMFRDPSFSRDQQGNVRLKANGRMEAIDASVAGAGDDLVVDLGQERVIVKASTAEEGTIFEREFPVGSLSYFERSGNRGWEHAAAGNDFMKFKMNNNYTRFNLELPGDDRMDALLDLVEQGSVHSRLVEFQIRFEEERIICHAETEWQCTDTGQRGHCNGPLQ